MVVRRVIPVPASAVVTPGGTEYFIDNKPIGGITTISLNNLQGAVRGYVIRGNANPNWEPHDAGGLGYVLVGDGDDVNSVLLSGDASIAADGTLTVTLAHADTTSRDAANAHPASAIREGVTTGRVMQSNAATGDLEAAALIGPAVNVLTLTADGAYSLDVPATGTAALLERAQTFTAANVFQNAVNSTGALVVNNAAGTNVLNVDTTNGRGGIGTALASRFWVNNDVASQVGQIIRGATSQSANLTEWQNSAGTVLASIGVGGYANLTLGSGVPSSSNNPMILVNHDSGGGFANLQVTPSATNKIINYIFHPSGTATEARQTFFNKGVITSGTARNRMSMGISATEVYFSFVGQGLDGASNIPFNLYPYKGMNIINQIGAEIAFVVRGATSQTVNLSEWQTAGAVVGLAVDKDFVIRATSQRTGAGVLEMLNLKALGSGANGDGGAVLMQGKSSTDAAQDMARLEWLWNDATHASRTSDVVLKTVLDGVLQEHLRLPGLGKYTVTLGGDRTLDANASGGVLVRAAATPLTAGRVPFSSDGNTLASTDILFFDSVNTRFGINTDTPEVLFHVKATNIAKTWVPTATVAMLFERSTAAIIDLAGQSTGSSRVWLGDENDEDVGGIEYLHATDQMRLRVNALSRVYIESNGDVLIGTATDSARLTVQGNADAVQFLVTGHTTQAVATPIAQITRNDTAAGVAAMFGLTALGSGANGAGGAVLMQGKSSTDTAQDMARLEWLWNDATHASRNPLLRARTFPKGTAYGAATPVWSWDGVDGTARIVVPGGVADVVYAGAFLYTVYAVTATDTRAGMATITPNTAQILYTDGTSTLTLACSAAGELTVQRTAGTDTFNVVLMGVWQ